MKSLAVYALMTAVTGMLGVAPACADDANSDRPIMTHKQMMKDCMAKERAAHPDAAAQDLKKTCLAKIQSYEQHPSETVRPPNNP